MKKFITLAMVLAMVLSLLAGCVSGEDTNVNDGNNEQNNAPAGDNGDAGENSGDDENSDAGEQTQGSLVILETIWNAYGESERFPVIGGNMEAPVDGAPGNYDMAYAENLTYNLLIPAEQLASVDEAATMVHMMNTNTFTGGVVHLVEGTDAAAFAAAMRDAIQGNQWMCGFPETLTVAVINGEYVVIAFGVNDAMTPFMTHLSETYPEAEILYNEAVAG